VSKLSAFPAPQSSFPVVSEGFPTRRCAVEQSAHASHLEDPVNDGLRSHLNAEHTPSFRRCPLGLHERVDDRRVDELGPGEIRDDEAVLGDEGGQEFLELQRAGNVVLALKTTTAVPAAGRSIRMSSVSCIVNTPSREDTRPEQIAPSSGYSEFCSDSLPPDRCSESSRRRPSARPREAMAVTGAARRWL
jgi:hypothetical protein